MTWRAVSRLFGVVLFVAGLSTAADSAAQSYQPAEQQARLARALGGSAAGRPSRTVRFNAAAAPPAPASTGEGLTPKADEDGNQTGAASAAPSPARPAAGPGLTDVLALIAFLAAAAALYAVQHDRALRAKAERAGRTRPAGLVAGPPDADTARSDRRRLSSREEIRVFLLEMGALLKDDRFEDRLERCAEAFGLPAAASTTDAQSRHLLSALVLATRTLHDVQVEHNEAFAKQRAMIDELTSEATRDRGTIADLIARVQRLEDERGAPPHPATDPMPPVAPSLAPPTVVEAADDRRAGDAPEDAVTVDREPTVSAAVQRIAEFLAALGRPVGADDPPLDVALAEEGWALANNFDNARDLHALRSDPVGQTLAAGLARIGGGRTGASGQLATAQRQACERLVADVGFGAYDLIWPGLHGPVNDLEHFRIDSAGARSDEIQAVVRPGLRRGAKILMRAMVKVA